MRTKVFLAGAGSLFEGKNGENFQNKHDVASYCSKIANADHFEFQARETADTAWVVHPRGGKVPTVRHSATTIPFNEFEKVLVNAKDPILDRPVGSQQFEGEMRHGDWDAKIAQKQEEVNRLQREFDNNATAENWQKLTRSKQELEDLKRARDQARQSSPYYPVAGSGVPPTQVRTYPEGELRRSTRIAEGRKKFSAAEAAEEEARKKKKKKKYTAVSNDRRRDDDDDDEDDEDAYWKNERRNGNDDDEWRNFEEAEATPAAATTADAAPKKRGRPKGKGKKKKKTTKGKRKTKGKGKKKTTGKGRKKRSTKK